MKKMILAAATFGLFLSCAKENLTENYLPGKWNMVQTELYENGTLKAVSTAEEVNTVYFFSSCETSQGSSCDMYIEEDGQQQYYPYMFDVLNKTLLLGESSVFSITEINKSQLVLIRDYDVYRSTYRFVKGE